MSHEYSDSAALLKDPAKVEIEATALLS